MTAAVFPAEVFFLQDNQHEYTYSQVEALLYRYLTRRDRPDLHGKHEYRLRRRLEQMDVRWHSASVNDSVIERVDLFRALAQLPHGLRTLLLLWYGTDWSEGRIIMELQRIGSVGVGGPKLSRRTLYRRKRIAVLALLRILNRSS